MRLISPTFGLCLALALSALTAPAVALDVAGQAALSIGTMKRFVFSAERPAAPGDIAFANMDGPDARLADFAGTPVLLNLWATWCAPCRAEMPSLSRLQDTMGADLKVVTLAAGRNPPPAVSKFFEEIGVSNLPRYLDPKQEVPRAMGVFGLPVSILIGADGREIGRLIGDAEWDNPEAIALIRAATAPTAGN